MADINLGVGGANSAVAGGYEIENSLKFEVSNGEGIWRVTDTTSNRRTFTCSMWFKPTEILTTNRFLFGSYLNSTNYTYIRHQSSGTLQFRGHPGSGNKILSSVAVFADTSAWYHLVLAVDTTQSTAANRVKIYINGEQIELTGTYPNQNQDQQVNLVNNKTNIGFMQGYYDTLFNFCGYIAESHFVDGTQYAASDFGEYDEDSGIWIPKKADVTYGSQGFYVKFDDASSLGADSSGNSNTLSLQNITSADQATDTPTNNFCVFNPLVRVNNNPTISEGGTKVTGGGGTWNQAFGTLGAKKGKWYYEVKIANSGDTAYYGASTFPAIPDNVGSAQLMYNTSFMVGSVASPDYYYWQNGAQVSNESTGWGSIAQNDVVGVALDLDASTKTFTIYKNGTALSGTLSQPVDLPTNMQDEFIFPMVVQYENSDDEYNLGGYTISSISSAASDANGYGNFEYAPPSGYYALCTKNLAEFG